MAPHMTHATIVVADSDIDVGPDYLCRVVGELSQPGVGAVTCLYYGDAAQGLWPQLSALNVDTHFLPSVTVALLTGLAEPAFGSTIALRRKAYDAIGGFAPFADQLADDYALGEAVRDAGWKVVIPPFLVAHACNETSFADLWQHELRWARTNRAVKPFGYAGTVITHPLPLALLGWLLGSFSCFLLAGAALAGRLWLCGTVERSLRVPPHNYWLVPVRELLSFAVFVWSFVGGRVTWRGEHFELGRDGAIIEAEPRHRR
jgi:ceramide glucosyltransferase